MKNFLILIFLILPNWLCSQQITDTVVLSRYMKDSLDVIASRVQNKIIPARYMEGTLISKTDTLKGWEKIEVSLYQYKVHGTDIIAKVYLADADSRKIASWIISTCVILTNKLSKTNTDRLIKDIANASGGQFPVLGMVYEDMYGTGQTVYYFKDGVTVFLKDKNPDNLWGINDNNIERVGKYGRIISTTREQYIQMFGEADLSGIKWLTVVKEEYKKALSSHRNNLILAWANGKLE
jgi:hypothetical protein